MRNYVVLALGAAIAVIVPIAQAEVVTEFCKGFTACEQLKQDCRKYGGSYGGSTDADGNTQGVCTYNW